MSRIDGRAAEDIRELRFTTNTNPYAEGSVIVEFGKTKVHVTASVEERIPPWLMNSGKGWITAEYGMLPRATHTRNRREASAGKQSGRTSEIQRLIGRSLRAAVDLRSIPEISISLDCDVMVADGGTRTASISGAWVALVLALRSCHESGLLKTMPEIRQISAVSVGVVKGVSMSDLCYEEDSNADFDLNLVFSAEAQLVEIQGTAEGQTIGFEQLLELNKMAWSSCEKIMKAQRASLA